jgi:predicted ATPase
MVIVENPEAHLHPSAQSKLGRFLAKIANSGVQIILETHSDHIINGIRIAIKKGLIKNEEVIFNSFSKGKKLGENIVEKIFIDKEGKLDKWPKGFFDQYENDMMELL